MECPFCKSDTKVIDVRTTDIGNRIRRRECKNPECKERFTTHELTQIQIMEKLDEFLPINLVDKISKALSISFPERDEVPDELFDFYFDEANNL